MKETNTTNRDLAAYEVAEIEIVDVNSADIICTSFGDGGTSPYED